MAVKTVWQDEKDFTLDVPVKLKNIWVAIWKKKKMFQMITSLRPRIRCQEKLWFPLQSLGTVPRNRFFVNENAIKVNKSNFCKHLKKPVFSCN